MNQMIDDLLAFSRLGRAEIHKTRFSMGPLVSEVIADLEQDTRNRQIEWVLLPLPVVDADRAMLRLVWQNLISNALKYTSKRPETRIEIGCVEHDEEQFFHIRDNGVGFDPEYADKLFGVFQRLHNQSEFEGTGIGLANVRRIIQRHGGTVWAVSAENAGATFYFSLPIMRQTSSA
jgi:light-regulated signal transduction histidine kinase (bacteriophytochrome)